MSLKILSYNMCLPPYGFDNTDDNRELRILSFLENFGYQYDVLLLQEVWSTVISDYTLRFFIHMARKYGFVYRASTVKRLWQLSNNGLLVLSKKPINKALSITFEKSAGLQWFMSTGAIHVNIENIDMFVPYIHTGPMDTSIGNDTLTCKEVQRSQIAQLKKFVDANATGRYIVAGDFNVDALPSHSANTVLSYNTLVEIMGSQSLLTDIGFAHTYPDPNFAFVNPKLATEQNCIDHVFTNILGVGINVKFMIVNGLSISDHAAVEIIL
jgi:endonuclease/exonuclease/phosphatase family metal-dependent hydrolase